MDFDQLTGREVNTDRYYYGRPFDVDKSPEVLGLDIEHVKLFPAELRAMAHLLIEADGDPGHYPYGRPVVEALEDRGFVVTKDHPQHGESVQLTTEGRMVVCGSEEVSRELVNHYLSAQFSAAKRMPKQWRVMGDFDEVGHWEQFAENIEQLKPYLYEAVHNLSIPCVEGEIGEEPDDEGDGDEPASKTDRAISEWKDAYREAHGEEPGEVKRLGGGWVQLTKHGSKHQAGEIFDLAENLRERARTGYYDDDEDD